MSLHQFCSSLITSSTLCNLQYIVLCNEFLQFYTVKSNILTISDTGLSHYWHNFQFYTSSQFLNVVNTDISASFWGLTLKEQLNSTYLTGPADPTSHKSCADKPHWLPLSHSMTFWNFCLLIQTHQLILPRETCLVNALVLTNVSSMGRSISLLVLPDLHVCAP
jgi:hypothetical protein